MLLICIHMRADLVGYGSGVPNESCQIEIVEFIKATQLDGALARCSLRRLPR
jgi:hypothetical protein